MILIQRVTVIIINYVSVWFVTQARITGRIMCEILLEIEGCPGQRVIKLLQMHIHIRRVWVSMQPVS